MAAWKCVSEVAGMIVLPDTEGWVSDVDVEGDQAKSAGVSLVGLLLADPEIAHFPGLTMIDEP